MNDGSKIDVLPERDSGPNGSLRAPLSVEHVDLPADESPPMDPDERTPGHIRLYRQIEESEVWADPFLLKVWLWCMIRASWKERWVPVSTGRGIVNVHLLPGQFIFGRNTAAASLAMPGSSVEGRMAKLQQIGNIEIRPVTHYSIVSVCKWASFQLPEEHGRHPSVTHPSPIRHKQEGKEG